MRTVKGREGREGGREITLCRVITAKRKKRKRWMLRGEGKKEREYMK